MRDERDAQALRLLFSVIFFLAWAALFFFIRRFIGFHLLLISSIGLFLTAWVNRARKTPPSRQDK